MEVLVWSETDHCSDIHRAIEGAPWGGAPGRGGRSQGAPQLDVHGKSQAQGCLPSSVRGEAGCVFHQTHWGLYRGRDWRESVWLGGFFQWSERLSSCDSKIQSKSPSLNTDEAAEIVRACCLGCRREGGRRHHLGTVQPWRMPGATPSPDLAQPTPRRRPPCSAFLTFLWHSPLPALDQRTLWLSFVSVWSLFFHEIQQAFLKLVRC